MSHFVTKSVDSHNQKKIACYGRHAVKTIIAILFIITFIFSFLQTSNAQIFWNQAGSFAGSANSYIAVPPSTELDITGSFTLECWINPNNVTSPSPQMLISKGYASSFTGYELLMDSGRVRVRTNGSTRLIGNIRVPNNSWVHFAATFDGSTYEFKTYVNATLDSSTIKTAAAIPTTNTDSIYLGKGFNNPYNGYMDNVRIWNRTLTQTEIRNNMRTALGATGGIYTGLVLSIPFQNYHKSYLNLYDHSGNGNTGINRGITNIDYTNQPLTYGTFNEAVKLDGTGDYLAGPNTVALDVTSFTLECWVNPTNAASPLYQNLIAKRLVGSDGYEIYLNSGRLSVRTNGTTKLTGNKVIPSGEWSHLAGVFDNSTNVIKIYIDGVFDDSVIIASSTPINNSDSLYIGKGINSPYAGYIDEIRISNYAKTQEQIKDYLYRSIEQTNEPNSGMTNHVYNLDGNTYDNAVDNGPRLYFRGDASFSNPSMINNVPISPLIRADDLNFPTGYYLKNSERRIPQTGTSGAMIVDSLYVAQSLTISDVNLFLAANHTWESSLQVKLVAPSGDSITVFSLTALKDPSDNLITIFDDQADSSILWANYTSFSPRIKPLNNLNAGFIGQNTQGIWQLRIYDNSTSDTGKVYAWGLQFNDQSVVGVEDIITSIPTEFKLFQNYPNPFNPTTTVSYALPTAQQVSLKVYNVIGQEVMTLVNERQEPGVKFVKFDASYLPSGVYLYRLNAGAYIHSMKMMVVK